MRLHFFTARCFRRLACFLLTAALLLALPAPALSANYAWRGDGGTNFWSLPTNWDPPTGPPLAGDTVVFDAGTDEVLNLDIGTPNVNLVVTGNVPKFLYVYGAVINTSSIDCSGVTSNIEVRLNTQVNLTGPATFRGCRPMYYLYLRGGVSNAGNTLTTQGPIAFSSDLSGSGGLIVDDGIAYITHNPTSYTGPTVINNNGDLRLTQPLVSTSYTLNDTSSMLLYNSDVLPDTASISIASGAELDLRGNNETIDTLSGTGSVATNGGTLTVGANNGTSTFGGVISGNGGLNKTGSGAFSLSGANTYTGATTINGGTLRLGGSERLANTGDVTVAAGATFDLNGFNETIANLSGSGTVDTGGGNLTVTTALNPGSSPGVITFLGGFSLAAGTLNLEIDGTNPGVDYDQVNVIGTVTLGGNLNLIPTISPVAGTTFVIIDNDGVDGVTGTFAGLAEGSTITAGGTTYRISYSGGTGNDVTLTVQASGGGGSTPEPTPAPTPTPDTPPAPKVPQGSGPSPVGSLDGTAFSWPLVKGATHYRIYRADCPLCPRKEIGRVTDNSFVDNTAIPGQPYTYWLRAENGDGLGVYSNWMAAWRYEQNPGRAGDFNGDGVADLLWWNRATGQITIWYMNGGAVIGTSSPMEGLDVSQWLLIGTGDFNGDGVCDLLWWKPETGEILFWYMQPGISTASAPFQAMSDPIPQTMPAHAALPYSGDLNADGYRDILWRNYSNGDLTIWLMGADGKPTLSGPPVPVDEAITQGGRPGITGTLQWQVAGLADADGDGKADVIWQDERNNRLVTWFMDGVNILRAIEENKGLEAVWRLVGLGDLNGDGHADIVWRNESNGEVKAWLMQAGKFSEERAIVEGSQDATQWQVKAVGDFCSPGCDDIYCKQSESSAVRIVKLDGREFAPEVE